MAKRAAIDAASRAWSILLTARERVVERAESALADAALPPLAWYDVLWALEQVPGGRLRMFELAERLVVARYNLTRIADRLVAAKLIERESCASDRRGSFCVLTISGRQMRGRMWPIYRDVIERLFAAQLKSHEIEAVAGSLQRVAQAARADASTERSDSSSA